MLEYLRKADFVLAVISWVIINPPSVNRLCLHAQYCSCYVCWLQSDSGCIVGTFSHRESIRKIYYLINWHTVWWQKWAGMSKERLPHGCRHFRGFLQWWNWTWEIISKCALCMEVIIPQRVYKRALSVILSMSSAMDRRVLLVLFCLQAVLLFTAFTSTDAAAGLVRAQSPLRGVRVPAGGRRGPTKFRWFPGCWRRPGGCSLLGRVKPPKVPLPTELAQLLKKETQKVWSEERQETPASSPPESCSLLLCHLLYLGDHHQSLHEHYSFWSLSRSWNITYIPISNSYFIEWLRSVY